MKKPTEITGMKQHPTDEEVRKNIENILKDCELGPDDYRMLHPLAEEQEAEKAFKKLVELGILMSRNKK